jgi:carbonic anhydrase
MPDCTCWTYCAGGDDWTCETCDGDQQSPIAITNCSAIAEPLQLKLGCAAYNATVTNTGTTVQYQVTCPTEANHLGSFTQGGTTHYVRYLRFHAPAEHQVQGKVYEMEMELVAYSCVDPCEDCCPTAVLSVFWEQGCDSSFLNSVEWGCELFRTLLLPKGDNCDELVYRCVCQINLQWLNQLVCPSYYRYDGSLTAPPCSQPVERFILCRPQQLSACQLWAFHKLLCYLPRTKNADGSHRNSRNRQPLGERTVDCHCA